MVITSLKSLLRRTRGSDLNHSNSIRNLSIYFGMCLACIFPASGQEVVEVGSPCIAENKLPQSFLCIEGFVIDCGGATGAREQLYFAVSELQNAEKELNELYQRPLKRLGRPNDEYANYQNTRKAFIEGQRSWVKFKKMDCEVPGYLNLKGSSQSSEIVACELKHTKNRIADLRANFKI